MVEKILAALKKSGVEQYQITETHEESAELFFIRKSLDMQRKKDVRTAEVVVYREFSEGGDRMLGSATVQLQDSFTEGQMEELFRDALYAAGFVRNKRYELYEGKGQEAPAAYRDKMSDKSLAEIAGLFADALYAEDGAEDVFVNSAEIFACRKQIHILNSRGVDVRFQKSGVKGEFVAQCVSGQDVETYQDFAYESLETEALGRKVRETLEMTRARAQAVAAPPAGEYRVILYGSYVRDLLDYYLQRSGSSMIYQKYSSFRAGCDVQGDGVEADRIRLGLKATEPYSTEGIPMRDRVLVRDGKLQLIHGATRFAYYLGIEPTGMYRTVTAPAGSVTLEQMRQAPHLEVVNFSDFQMDNLSGHFGGEIRLAFLYDGERRVPVTGGSVNGNILEAQKHFIFSRETQTESRFEGPVAVCMEKVSVAGA